MIEPHGLLLGHRSYLVARQPARSETILNFRMDRIHAAEVMDESFAFAPGFVLEDYAARAFGVYQDPARGTCPSMTILENMSMADNKGKPFNLMPCVNRKKTEEYRAMLAQLGLGLEDKMGVPVGNLSGGQRQAMALLMSTMTPIEFLILDEHTAALDPKTAEIIMELTGRIVREKQLTTIMVTHNLRYAVEYGDRLLMMHQGRAEMDVSGEARKNLKVEDILEKFNAISIECGN